MTSILLVQEKVKHIIELLSDESKLEEERENAKKLRQKIGSKSLCKMVSLSTCWYEIAAHMQAISSEGRGFGSFSSSNTHGSKFQILKAYK